MNVYKQIAFGAFGLMALALIIGALYGQLGLQIASVFMLVVALLTLKTTWQIMLMVLRAVFTVVSATGHLVGIIGDEVVDWSKGCMVKLNSDHKRSSAPGWDSSELVIVDSFDATSPFLEGALSRSDA